ncbi:MAG: cupin domain-containing protein [Thainema sp.]
MPHTIEPFNLASTYVVINHEGGAVPVPVSDTFFEDLEHQFGEFKGKQLVSYFTFDQDWDTWEMHPAGDEVVYLLSGQVEFILQQDAAEIKVQMNTPGTFLIVPQGVWHTAKVYAPSSMLFITPGAGTQNRSL